MKDFEIVEGADYDCISGIPTECVGRRFRVIQADITDVPSLQHKILLQALTGPATGKYVTCTPRNFLSRHAPVMPAAASAEEKIAGVPAVGRGV